jgi:hypothetical protein
MFAVKLVQLIETHADALSEGLMHELKNSERCRELLNRVPADELRRRTYEIYRNLGDWLLNKTETEVEERYIGLGTRRARQGVPFSNFLWAISITKEYLAEYLLREGVLEEPVEFYGEMELLRSVGRFFDRVLFFTAIGYEHVARGQASQGSVVQGRSA